MAVIKEFFREREIVKETTEVAAGRYRFVYFPSINGRAVLQAYLGGDVKGEFSPTKTCIDRTSIERVETEDDIDLHIDAWLDKGYWPTEA